MTDKNKSTTTSSSFPIRTGDTVLFDRNCRMMQFPLGWAVCNVAKDRGTPYDHVGVAVVQPAAAAVAAKPKQRQEEKQQQNQQDNSSSNHVATVFDHRAQVVDAVFRGVIVRSLADAAKRKYNDALRVRALITEEDDAGSQNVTPSSSSSPNSIADFEAMRDKANAANGMPYKRRFLHFLASSLPALPDRRDAATVQAAALMRLRFALSLEHELAERRKQRKQYSQEHPEQQKQQQLQNQKDEDDVFSAILNRRVAHLRREAQLLHKVYAARRRRLERSTWRFLAGLNDGGTHDAGFFCSEVTTSVLQSGSVIDSFPPATSFVPSDYAGVGESGSDSPFPVVRPSVNVHSCFTAPIEVKPTVPDRGCDVASSKASSSKIRTSAAKAAKAAIARELERKQRNRVISAAADSFTPMHIEQGQIVWLDENAAEAVFTSDVSCILIRESDQQQQQQIVGHNHNSSNKRPAPFEWLAAPPANCLFTAQQFRRRQRVGILAKGCGNIWVSTGKQQQQNSQRTHEIAASASTSASAPCIIEPNSSLFSNNSNSNSKTDAVLYRVLDGSLEYGGRRYFPGDTIGSQELMVRAVGAFPRSRLGGWENELARESAANRGWSDPEQPLLQLSAFSDDIRSGAAGAVVEEVSASELMPLLADMAATAAAHFRVVASVAAASDPSALLTMRESQLLLLGENIRNSSSGNDVDLSLLLRWLMFRGRLPSALEDNNSIDQDDAFIEFADIMRAATSLQRVVDANNYYNNEDVKEHEQQRVDAAIFVDTVLLPALEAAVNTSDRTSTSFDAVTVSEVNEIIAKQLFGDDKNNHKQHLQFIEGSGVFTIDELVEELSPNPEQQKQRQQESSSTLKLTPAAITIVEQLQLLAKRCTTNTTTVDANKSASSAAAALDNELLLSLLPRIGGGWSTRNSIAELGVLKQQLHDEKPSARTMVIRLWIAVASGVAASAVTSSSSLRSALRGGDDALARLMTRFMFTRACAAFVVHAVLLVAAVRLLQRRDEKRIKRMEKLKMKTKNNNNKSDEHADSLFAAPHPRWRYLKVAAATGFAAAIATLPFEHAMYRQVAALNASAAVSSSTTTVFASMLDFFASFKSPQHMLRFVGRSAPWALLTAAPYVGAVQWLFAHELLLPAGMMSPNASPSFLFPQFDLHHHHHHRQTSSSTPESFNWLFPGMEVARFRIFWVGAAITSFAALVHPLEQWRRAAMMRGVDVPVHVKEQFRNHGAVGALRGAYRGFGRSLRWQVTANVASYSFFSVGMMLFQ